MRWQTLSWNGPAFSTSYEYKQYPIRIKSIEVILEPAAEEMAYHWAAKTGTPYVKDKTFCRNFWQDFKKIIPKSFIDTKFPEDWDFSIIYQDIQTKKETRKNRTRQEKEQAKQETIERKQKHGYATMDGHKIEVANYIVEPPGLFMGRGKNALRGRWKSRITTEDVILNLGNKIKGSWKDIVHNQDAIWLAFWRDKLTGNYKYIMPSPKSYIMRQSEIEKFDKAVELIGKMPEAIDFIDECMKSKDKNLREIATVCSLIAHTGIRVGDEKDKDEAKIYGATTLLGKHIEIKDKLVYFKFLGKDSVLYKETVELPELTVANLKKIIKFKNSNEQIFSNVGSQEVNLLLDKFMSGLTAKVFRTAIATKIMQEYLSQHKDKSVAELKKIKIFKEANILVAKKLNHHKTPTESAITALTNKKQKLQKNKVLLTRLKKSTNEQLTILKTNKLKMARSRRKKDTVRRLREATKRNNLSYKNKKLRLERKLERAKNRLDKLVFQTELKEKTLSLNLNTSLASYIDPRVVFEWAKKVKLDLRHIYTQAHLDKYEWAK